MKRNTWIALTAGVVVVGGVSTYLLTRPSEEVKWRTAKIDKGNITQKISATGSLNALVQVPVGTQVSGVVTGLYADFNSLVKKGQVIARIDSTVWETQIKDAEAGLLRAQASYENAKAEYSRNKRLAEAKLLATSDLEAKELALKSAEASLQSARASVSRAKINLGYCTITAPVDGVVVSRVVDEGQTVAASFSTPNLFTIAQDLSRLKVQAAIDEADIGQVQVGQKAFFTVDSYPDRQFQGQVTEVQLNPVVNNNVVTYNVVMQVNNQPRTLPEGGMRPDRRAEKGEGGKPREFKPGAMGRGPQGENSGAMNPGAQGRKPGAWGPGSQTKQPAREAKDQSATVEVATARYIPAGSPVYKGDLALFPGMTANVTIVTQQRSDVLRVPNAALRFNPAAFQKNDKKATAAPAAGPRPGGAGNKGGMMTRREDRIWILENGKPKALTVKAGVTDGQFTEVTKLPPVEGQAPETVALQEGIDILVGVEDLKKTATTAAPVLGAPGGRH